MSEPSPGEPEPAPPDDTPEGRPEPPQTGALTADKVAPLVEKEID